MELFTKVHFACLSKNLIRSLSTAGANLTKNHHHHVLIVGGGSAGSAVASRMVAQLGPGKVAVIEPNPIHYYQPLWTLVGAGIRKFEESTKPMKSVIPSSAKLIPNHVVQLDPTKSCVTLDNGDQVSYDYLVLALGMTLRYDLIRGAEEALAHDSRVCSNYSPRFVEKTWKAFQAFQQGNAVFTLPCGPIKCAGAPQKVMYLFDDYLRKHGTRDKAQIHYFTALGKMFSVDKYSNSLVQICKERNIQFNLFHHLVEVNHNSSEAVFEHTQTKELRHLKYDLLHITPPMCVPDVLKATPKLTSPKATDYVNVDSKTLRHVEFPNIFAVGDCSSLPTSKTAAAISSQSRVLAENLLDVIKGGSGNVAQYDGYTACPLVTGYNRGIMAEFDYTMQPLETLPIDQSKERYVFYFMKAIMMPPLYWDWFVKGLWGGPSKVRKFLHLGKSRP